MGLTDARGFTAAGAGALGRHELTEVTLASLRALWGEATQDQAGDWGRGIALACTGSLARGDGGPLSDLDLVLLHDIRGPKEAELGELSDRLWYPLWDCGIELDHAVRTPAQCRSVASQDLNVAWSLLDLQPIAGDSHLVDKIREQLSQDWRAAARKRLPEATEAVLRRHDAVGELAQQLEPDLKEASGGLRDMTVLIALTRSWLADRPHGASDAAYQHLLDVRDALQVVTRRSRNRLSRPDQPAVAELLGLRDEDELLASINAAGRTLSRALSATMRSAGQAQRARRPRLGPRRPELTALGDGVYAHDGEIVLGRGSDPSSGLQLLHAAATSSQANLPLAPTTVTNLATAWDDRGTTDARFPWPLEANQLFVELLRGPGLIEIWESLDEAGIIDRWLPDWAAVRGRPQRNGVHRHTVERHLLETVLAVQRLLQAEHRIADVNVLLLAGLLHDIGKLPDSVDHSVTGAPLARRSAERLGFSPRQVDDVELLVREHLTLVELATKADASDPVVISQLAGAVSYRPDLLELLAALTEADARAVDGRTAVHKKAWTPWRASLVRTLTERAREEINSQSGAPPPTNPRQDQQSQSGAPQPTNPG